MKVLRKLKSLYRRATTPLTGSTKENVESTLIDTRNNSALVAAKNMLRYRHQYFSKDSNVKILKEICSNSPEAIELIEELAEFQKQSANYFYDNCGTNGKYIEVKSVVDNDSSNLTRIMTEIHKHTPEELIRLTNGDLSSKMDVFISESINGMKVYTGDKVDANNNLSNMISSAWIVEHFALMLMGILSLHKSSNGSFIFTVKEKDALRYAWFGQALEEMTNIACTQAIVKLAVNGTKLIQTQLNNESFNELQLRVRSILVQHWRLGVGSFIEKMFSEIDDLTFILVEVIRRELSAPHNPAPLSESDLKRISRSTGNSNSLIQTYRMIQTYQASKKQEDRLFSTSRKGISLGPLSLNRGMIQQLEYFAEQKLGKNWNIDFERQQIAYLSEYLERFEHLRVVKKDFNPSAFKKDEQKHFDVDLLVRDLSLGKLYLVQLKHVKYLDSSGIQFWIDMLADVQRPKKKLYGGVTQLENAKSEFKNNANLIAYLKDEHGVTSEELGNITPVLVHNIGSIDFFKLQNGIMVYDIHTFRKAITGKSATKEHYIDDVYQSSESYDPNFPSLDLGAPKDVIKSYLSESRFSGLRYFDTPKYLRRRVKLLGTKVIADGVGI